VPQTFEALEERGVRSIEESPVVELDHPCQQFGNAET
jgi:hypothetical protein